MKVLLAIGRLCLRVTWTIVSVTLLMFWDAFTFPSRLLRAVGRATDPHQDDQ